MIIPSRWFAGGWGLDEFRMSMITENKIMELHDYPNAADCFPGVEIKGGVCYFLWGRDYSGKCKFVSHSGEKIISKAIRPLKEENCDILIRYNEGINILHKVRSKNEKTFDALVSTKSHLALLPTIKTAKRFLFPDLLNFMLIGVLSMYQEVKLQETKNIWTNTKSLFQKLLAQVIQKPI